MEALSSNIGSLIIIWISGISLGFSLHSLLDYLVERRLERKPKKKIKVSS